MFLLHPTYPKPSLPSTFTFADSSVHTEKPEEEAFGGGGVSFPRDLQDMSSEDEELGDSPVLTQLRIPVTEKEMATHSSVLAWRIPGTEEPGGLPSMGLHRVGHD